MNHVSRVKSLILPVAVGVFMAWALLAGMGRASASLQAGGADLSPESEPYEINIDASGRLWISEYGADQARHVDPATGAYTLYTGLPGVLDAQLDEAGQLWWTGWDDNTLGRLDPATGEALTYSIKVANPWNVVFDDDGLLWIMDDGNSSITTFNPATESECYIDLPAGRQGAHNQFRDGAIWASDYVSDSIMRITPITSVVTPTFAFTAWPISSSVDSLPYDLVFEADGSVWAAIYGMGRVARLEPDTNTWTFYGQEDPFGPITVLLTEGKVWYTDYDGDTLGFIDLAAATPAETWSVTPVTATLTPGCYTNNYPYTFTAGITTGVLLFDSLELTSTTSANGAAYYLQPATDLWGLARVGDELWFAGASDDRLYRLEIYQKLFLPLLEK